MSHHPTFDDRGLPESEPREPLRTMPHAYPIQPESREAEPPAHEHQAHEHQAHEHQAHEHQAHEHQAHEHQAHEHHEHAPGHHAEPHPAVTPAPTPAPTPATPPSHQAIAARAYAKFIARGRKNGNDLDDWLQAERELRSEPQPHAVSG